jgi:hypothetical protein
MATIAAAFPAALLFFSRAPVLASIIATTVDAEALCFKAPRPWLAQLYFAWCGLGAQGMLGVVLVLLVLQVCWHVQRPLRSVVIYARWWLNSRRVLALSVIALYALSFVSHYPVTAAPALTLVFMPIFDAALVTAPRTMANVARFACLCVAVDFAAAYVRVTVVLPNRCDADEESRGLVDIIVHALSLTADSVWTLSTLKACAAKAWDGASPTMGFRVRPGAACDNQWLQAAGVIDEPDDGARERAAQVLAMDLGGEGEHDFDNAGEGDATDEAGEGDATGSRDRGKSARPVDVELEMTQL